ncbi:DUF305 domain-containing protein [Umezawaea endophytica]|uniref:DUF305 domain-containing protein n=1 Tax=Umezawaea endophytica TaxID=1654476 RepID=A0A9X2VIE9_9PSEU|nr:DUF305 domain-containing protein [Umezawaea endophytica]MCS7477235.1 DUF305 domain-containing protein [Umezawaea endophytica]
MRARLLVVAVIGLMMSLSACSSLLGESAAAGAGANDADIVFLRDMLPHHQQTLEISGLVGTRSKNAAVVEVANAITAEGSAEIDKMNGWLTEWKVGVTDSGHKAHEMVVAPKDVSVLGGYTGPQFDKQWSPLMVRHLQDGIKMAQDVESAGTHAGVKALAKEMITVQTGLVTKIEGTGAAA